MTSFYFANTFVHVRTNSREEEIKRKRKKTTTNQTNQRMILSMCAGGVGFSRKIIENIISTRPVFSVN